MSTNTISQFSRFSSERSDRPTYDRSDRNNRDNRDNRNNNRNNNKNHYDDGKKEELTQVPPDWFNSSDFCRTNVKTGAVMWKEELYKQGKMNELRLGKSGDSLRVPIGWKFQAVAPGHYHCKETGMSFMYESAYIIHKKQLASRRLSTGFGNRNF